MGGSSSEKESGKSFFYRAYDIGYRFLDFVTLGSLSKSAQISRLEGFIKYFGEEKRILLGRVQSLRIAHEKEERKWAKRIGRVEAENKGLGLRLAEAVNEIVGLEGRLAKTQGDLALVQERYTRAKAIIDANEELEGALADLEEFHMSMGIANPNAGKNALDVIRRQRAFVRMAYEKVEEAERGNVLGRSYTKHLKDDRVVFVLDEKHRIEAMSPAAKRLVGKDITGKEVTYVSSTLGMMLGYTAPTYEGEFSAILGSVGDSKDVRVKVNLERYYDQHIGAFVVVEPARFWQRAKAGAQAYTLAAPNVFDDGAELTKMVNATIAIDYNRKIISMDLRATREVSDDVARRIGGLAQSKYFRNRLKIVVSDGDVYDKLMRYDVPKELIVDMLEPDIGVKGVPAQVRLT